MTIWISDSTCRMDSRRWFASADRHGSWMSSLTWDGRYLSHSISELYRRKENAEWALLAAKREALGWLQEDVKKLAEHVGEGES